MSDQATRLRPQRPFPGTRICLRSTVCASPSMARQLPTDRGGRAPQASCDAANRLTGSNPAGNLFALIEHQRYFATAPSYRRNAPVKGQDMVDRALGPLQRTGDIARALAT